MNEEKTKEQGWNFDNSYARLPKSLYSRLSPPPVRAPKLAILNEALAKALGLNVQELQSEEGVAVLAGNLIPEDAMPLAQAYAGHQFGHFTMLGDGRAILLGEQITPQGERFDIQLKGSGRTPYSRRGDGRAALGPMLREYMISEAMHALGFPTTRSLAVVETGEVIYRETALPGAILTRVAASHIRVGTFQFVRQWGTEEELKELADYTIQRHYPQVKNEENNYLSLLQEVIKRQAALIAKWQLVGFIHGVMNTDNMTISGETIDYGPCAFMDSYDPATVFSSIDEQGRYAYGNQPYIAAWNLARFAETLLPLIHEDADVAVKMAEDEIKTFPGLYQGHWLQGMRAKLGLLNEEPEDEALIKQLLDIMEANGADFTNTFRALTMEKPEETGMSCQSLFIQWHEQWQERISRQTASKAASIEVMRANNPVVIPRNHRVEEALDAAVEQGDYSVVEKLLNVLSHPYAYDRDLDEIYLQPMPSNRPYQTFCGT